MKAWISQQGPQFGLLAQDVQKVIKEIVEPHSVSKDGEELLGVNYIELIPILTAAMQEQQKIIDEHKQLVNEQQNSFEETLSLLLGEIENLKSEIKNLKDNR